MKKLNLILGTSLLVALPAISYVCAPIKSDATKKLDQIAETEKRRTEADKKELEAKLGRVKSNVQSELEKSCLFSGDYDNQINKVLKQEGIVKGEFSIYNLEEFDTNHDVAFSLKRKLKLNEFRGVYKRYFCLPGHDLSQIQKEDVAMYNTFVSATRQYITDLINEKGLAKGDYNNAVESYLIEKTNLGDYVKHDLQIGFVAIDIASELRPEFKSQLREDAEPKEKVPGLKDALNKL